MEAIESGDEAGVKRELDDGADPLFSDDEGFTALHMACQEGYDAIATMLIRKGAKMDATDDEGTTPLMLASSGGHVAVVEMLIKEAGGRGAGGSSIMNASGVIFARRVYIL